MAEVEGIARQALADVRATASGIREPNSSIAAAPATPPMAELKLSTNARVRE